MNHFTGLTTEEMIDHPSNKDIKTLMEKRSNLYATINTSAELITFLLKSQDTTNYDHEAYEQLITLTENWKQSLLLVDSSINELFVKDPKNQ